MNTILVTGSNGFVSKNLINYLINNFEYNIIGVDVNEDKLDNKKYKFIKEDLNKIDNNSIIYNMIKKGEINFIIHLAGIAQELVAYENPLLTCEINISITYKLLNLCLDSFKNGNNIKIIVASTDKVYGELNKTPYKEEDKLNVGNIYETSKICADILSRSFNFTYNLPVCIARSGNIYGNNDVNNTTRLIPTTINKILKNENPIIRLNEDGKDFIRDFVYIDDIINGLVLLMKKMENDKKIYGEAFNFSYGQKVTPRDIIYKILDYTKSNLKPIEQIFSEEYKEIKYQWVDNRKAEEILGWKPQVNINNGIQKILENNNLLN